jgi:hypothetical protein
VTRLEEEELRLLDLLGTSARCMPVVAQERLEGLIAIAVRNGMDPRQARRETLDALSLMGYE